MSAEMPGNPPHTHDTGQWTIVSTGQLRPLPDLKNHQICIPRLSLSRRQQKQGVIEAGIYSADVNHKLRSAHHTTARFRMLGTLCQFANEKEAVLKLKHRFPETTVHFPDGLRAYGESATSAGPFFHHLHCVQYHSTTASRAAGTPVNQGTLHPAMGVLIIDCRQNVSAHFRNVRSSVVCARRCHPFLSCPSATYRENIAPCSTAGDVLRQEA